jgi:putative acetyltransferase
VLGEPAFYGRFGFAVQPDLRLPGVPPEYFQVLAFGTAVPAGTVAYHEAFNATE